MSILRRLFRRGADAAAAQALVTRLSQYSIEAEPLSADAFRDLVESNSAGRNVRIVAAVNVAEPGVDLALITRIAGPGAAHSGQLQAVGAHLLMARDALSSAWPERWTAALRAMPSSSERDLGAVRDFHWAPSDASDADATAAALRLSKLDPVHRRVLGLLRGGSGQFEIVPSASQVRIAVHQYGQDLPDPTALEALISVARALRDAE